MVEGFGFRTIAFAVVFCVCIGLAFTRDARYGIFAYLWAFYLDPSIRWWGSAIQDFRWSLIAAVVTVVALAVPLNANQSGSADRTDSSDSTQPPRQGGRFRKLLPPPGAPPPPAVWQSSGFLILAAYSGWMWVQSSWAVDPDMHALGRMAFTKFSIFYALLFLLLRDPKRMEFFAFAHVVGCLQWAFTSMSTEVSGRYDTFLGPGVDDSNMIGIHMITGLAIAGFLFLTKKGWTKWFAFATLPFILNTIILTASRSAQIGLVVAGLASVVFAPKSKRLAVGVCGALGLVLLLMLAQNEVFWDRAKTIEESASGDERGMEASAASRWVIADANLRMARDYPFGAGYRGNEKLSAYYIPPEYLTAETSTRSAHNTALAILVDNGIPGLILYVLMVGWVAVRLTALLLLDRHGLPTELGGYRAALGACLAAIFVGGQFINALRLEVGIWMIAMLSALDAMCIEWRQEQERRTQPAIPRTTLPTAKKIGCRVQPKGCESLRSTPKNFTPNRRPAT
jgi:hypothetical protein